MSGREDAYMLERGGVMSSAIGLARLWLSHGDPGKAAEILDDCCDELHRLHWDACLADGHEHRTIAMLLGPRNTKAMRSWKV